MQKSNVFASSSLAGLLTLLMACGGGGGADPEAAEPGSYALPYDSCTAPSAEGYWERGIKCRQIEVPNGRTLVDLTLLDVKPTAPNQPDPEDYDQ